MSLAILGLAGGILWLRDGEPRVVVYSFILSATARVLLIEGLLRFHARSPRARPLLERLVRTPPLDCKPEGLTRDGQPATLGGHLLVLFSLSLFALLLVHIGRKQELVFEFSKFAADLGWSVALAILFGVKDLLSRDLRLRFDAPKGRNYAYNVAPFTVLAVAVVIAGGLVTAVQSMGKVPSPWLMAGPLLGLKHLFDFLLDLPGEGTDIRDAGGG